MTRDLNESLIFVKVVERGSFTAAASVLGLPKTTVSRKVAELEQRLGTKLLMRTTRKLGLTEAGQIYYERCAQIARELDDAEAAVGMLSGAPRGWLRFTAPYSVGINTISHLLRDFMAQYPEVRVEMQLDNDVVDLVDHELDLALRMGPLADSSLSARRLVTVSAKIYASPEYLARHGEPLSPDELEHHRAIAMTKHRRNNGRYAWRLGRDDTFDDYAIHPVLVVNDPFSVRTAALQGLGLAGMLAPMAQGFEQHGALRPVIPAWSSEPIELNAVFPHGRVLSPKVRAFVDFLAERLTDAEALSSLPSCALERAALESSCRAPAPSIAALVAGAARSVEGADADAEPALAG